MKIVKVLLINLIILLFLILTLETVTYYMLKIKGVTTRGWLYVQDSNDALIETTDPCRRMKTHPFYAHAHDHNSQCQITGGVVKGGFVYYDISSDSKVRKTILTLGGSTTDGLYEYISEGKTWPYLLNQDISKRGLKYRVINGGVGGYSSSQELLKLLMEGPFVKDLSYVISLNGINDIPGYRRLGDIQEGSFPFWTWVHMRLYVGHEYVDQNALPPRIFPNLVDWVQLQARKNINFNDPHVARALENINPSEMTNPNRSTAEQWFYNVRVMHQISEELGAKYFVFLQPTMGLSNAQIPSDLGSKDGVMYKNMSKDYLKKINDQYSELRKYCKKLSYCIDISDSAPPTGDLYYDARHHNGSGNKIIANKVLDAIQLK